MLEDVETEGVVVVGGASPVDEGCFTARLEKQLVGGIFGSAR